MQKVRYGIFIPAILFLLLSGSTLFAEGHITIEKTFKYMNRTYPKNVTDLWFGDNSFTIKSGQQTIIYRKDLGKVWTIFTRRNKYYEQTINDTNKPEEKDKETVSVHKLGQDYEPQYYWTVKSAGENEKAGAYDCKKILVNGDADYAGINIEIWAAENAPVRMNDLLKTAFKYMSDENWSTIKKLYPELSDYFIVKSIETKINAIAPDMVNEKIMTITDNAVSPENIYEVPKGCVKVNSIIELYK